MSAWRKGSPPITTAERLIETQLRVSRVVLATKILRLAQEVQSRGGDPRAFVQLREALRPKLSSATAQEVDVALVAPTRPQGVWRKKYLKVTYLSGSVF